MIGDRIKHALEIVGVSQESVSEWLGRQCNCSEYQEKLNRLHAWAVKTVKESSFNAVFWIKEILK